MSRVEATQFKGIWRNRMSNLFQCGVSFSDKSVLDVGCNMGIVGYEVCKRDPKSYHGIEILPDHANVARSIFKAVPVPSKITIGDLSWRNGWMLLEDRYDVVLYLAVHQHIRKAHGVYTARNVALELFGKCDELIFRGPDLEEIKGYAEQSGFRIVQEYPADELYPLCSFKRKNKHPAAK